MYYPRNLGMGNRLAEIIARVDGRLNGLALQHARGLGGHLHLILRLLVVLDGKVRAFDVGFARLHRDVVETELGVRRNCIVPVRGPHVREFHGLLPDRLIGLRIAQLELQFALDGDLITVDSLRPHDRLEMNCVPWPVNRAVGVGIAFQRLVGIVTQVPRAGRVDCELAGAGGEHRDAGLLAGSDWGIDQSLRIGLPGEDFFPVNPHANLGAGNWITAAAVDNEAHEPAWRSFRNDAHIGDDDDGVGAQCTVGCFNEVHTLVGHRDGHTLALPALVRRNCPLPDRHHLLLV